MLHTESFTDLRKQELYGDLFQSISERFSKTHRYGRSQFHVIPWWEEKESEAEAERRYLASNPGIQIMPEDLRIFLRQWNNIEERL